VALKLHLDEDASIRALQKALVERGHDVTRTPNDWMPLAASDEEQLSGAAAQGRCLFTFNVRNFVPLAERVLDHAGIVVASRTAWNLSQLIASLDRFLESAPEMTDRLRWLNDSRGPS